MNKKLSYILIFAAVPLILVLGIRFLNDRQYNLISMAVTLLGCLCFYMSFENRKIPTAEIVIIAVMVALASIGRVIFYPLPAFKPVTAIIILTAMYFGPEAGFVTGSLTALVSGIFYLQGPWVPFQMFVWGIIGFVAGLLSEKKLLSSRLPLCIYGVISGALFSLVMDIWTVISVDRVFSFSRYLTMIGLSMPFMLMYCASNVIFLLLLANPLGNKFKRIKMKYL